MPIAPFKLERFYAKYEFNTKIMLSSSDCESLSMAELLETASPTSQAMWNNLKLGYTETQGHPQLREEISRQYEKISNGNVMVAAPEEAIYIAMRALLKPGDHVIVLTPAYQSLYEIAKAIGCQVTRWNLQPRDDRWEIDFDLLESAINPSTKMLVVNLPNNPTGWLSTRPEFETLIRIACEHNLYLFSDEMYRLLEIDPNDRLPAVCDAYEKGISLAGLSKTMALPGLRIGWLATQAPELMERWLNYKDYTTICNSAPSEILGIIALQNKAKIIQRNMDLIHANLHLFETFVASHHQLFHLILPKGGSIAFPQWMGLIPVEEVCELMLNQYGTMIVPGSMFDHPGNYFRLGLGRLNFSDGMASFADFLRS